MKLTDAQLKGEHSEAFKAYIAKRYSKYGYPKNKAILFNPSFTPEWAKRETYRWVENVSDGLRFVGKVSEIRGTGEGNQPYFDRALVDHNGWYVDSFQSELAIGAVYQLPARDGESQYVPAVLDPWNNDCAIVDFHSVTDDLTDAIRWADSMAESYAEMSREDEAKQRAEDRIEEIADEIKEKYATFKALAVELRGNCDALKGLEQVRGLIQAEYKRVKRAIRKLRAERAKLQDNFWEAVDC
jgi:hypothetical protein